MVPKLIEETEERIGQPISRSQTRVAHRKSSKVYPDDASRLLGHHGHLREFACGGGAALVNVVLTFPPNKLMFRQQIYGVSVPEAWSSLVDEGWYRLYRGVTPPLVSAMVSKAIMFGMYNYYYDLFWSCQEWSGRTGIDVSRHVAALASGTTEALLSPFERVQTLLQIPKYNHEFHSTHHAFLKLWNLGGVRELYRGSSAILMRNGPSNIVFFGLREPLRDALPPARTKSTQMMTDFITGGLLGAGISTLFYPVNVAKSHMQSKYNQEYMNLAQAMRSVYIQRDRNLKNFLRGIEVNFSRSLMSWGILNTAYEFFKERI